MKLWGMYDTAREQARKPRRYAQKMTSMIFTLAQRSRLSDLSARTKQKKSQSRNFTMGKLYVLDRQVVYLRKAKYMNLRTDILNITMVGACRHHLMQ